MTRMIPISRQQADTQYGKGVQYGFDIYPWWNNLHDRDSFYREFSTGHPEKMRIAQAMISQNPLTPDSEIRQNMTVHSVPAKTGYPTAELTVSQVLNKDFADSDHVNDAAWNDFSGEQGEINSTQRPYLNVW